MARIKLPENVAVAHAMHGGAPHPAAALGALLAERGYDDKPFTLEALVEKLEGRSEFTGVSSTDAFCGLADTRV